MQSRVAKHQRNDVQIPVAHRRLPPASLRQIEKEAKDRNAAIVQAHGTGAYSYQQIAEHFGMHFTTAGRIEGCCDMNAMTLDLTLSMLLSMLTIDAIDATRPDPIDARPDPIAALL